MKHLFLILSVWLCSSWAFNGFGETRYGFRIYLKDKGETTCRVEQPEQFLSAEAIERRKQQSVPVTGTDLPISAEYVRQVQQCGCTVVARSKWMQTMAVVAVDSTCCVRLLQLPFIDSVRYVGQWQQEELTFEQEGEARLLAKEEPRKNYYGYAESQIRMLNGIRLHKAGFTGHNRRVAVIDAGFAGVDRMAYFDSLQVAGTYNVASPSETVYAGDEHGTKVLSCLAAKLPGIMVGTAPDATYWLIRSEVRAHELPIEEDYWAAAVEYADSVGVEVISSSLGYSTFDEETLDYTPAVLDGRQSYISQVAGKAAEKGLLLFCSAGNEGASSWKTITVPADAPDVISVGAIDDRKKRCAFSSVGYTADGRVKPDVVALGTQCCVIDAEGEMCFSSGTSFAAPTLAGLAICLWQAYPQLTNRDLIRWLREGSSLSKQPNRELGYGIPDFYRLYKRLRHAYR